jgi:hypothetical protein
MAKALNNLVLDSALNYIKDNSLTITFTETEPADLLQSSIAAATPLIIKGSLTSGDFTGPVDGDVSGRKVTVDAFPGLSVESGVSAQAVTYAVLDDGTNILAKTTVTSQVVNTGETWDSPTFDIEIEDPT